ncbi:MAG: DUF2079 domain-containing protein [bacterium]|nr:DUF2079 domain-containing protein [bacterium]
MLIVFFISVKLANFKYNNFMYGKFDLGNMSQVVWNNKHGNFNMVTDQFGNDISRLGMSHVDLTLFVVTPLYFIKEDPRLLIFFQQFVVVLGAIAVYLLANQLLKSKNLAFLWGVIYLVYPAVGHILTKQTFHGVSLSAVFLLYAIYFYIKNQAQFHKYNLIIFWLLIFLTLLGKEEIPLVISMFGLWIVYKFKDIKTGLSLFLIGIIWFLVAFFVLIPKYENLRSVEFDKFITNAKISNVNSSDFFKSNFFLHRYSQLGDSYTQVASSLILHPVESTRVSISSDDKEAIVNVLAPLLFLPVIAFPILLISLPEIAINILSNQNIFAIDNHRVSMFIPIVFLASLYVVSKQVQKLQYMLTILIILSSVYFSFKTNNLLLIEISKKIGVEKVFADNMLDQNLDRAISDTGCINKILKQIPDDSSYTGPNYMGAQTSLRKTNAVYPMRFYDAEYLAIDVKEFSVHANEIGITDEMQKSVTAQIFNSESYKIIDSCKSLFLFKRL